MKLTQTQANAILAAGLNPVRRDLSGFAEACYNSNTADDLIGFATVTADATDCEEWGLSADEWRNAQREALELALANFIDSHTNANTNLITGQAYNVNSLTLLGWTEGDGTGSEAYNLHDYFDADDRYLGPDQHGIEPVVRESES